MRAFPGTEDGGFFFSSSLFGRIWIMYNIDIHFQGLEPPEDMGIIIHSGARV